MPGCLILICGLPGSGKSTLAKRFEEERGTIRLTPDELVEIVLEHSDDLAERDRLRDPAERFLWDLGLRLVRQGHSVTLENGFWAKEERDAYAESARRVGASVELHVMDAPRELLLKRVGVRNNELPTTWILSEEDVLEYWGLFQSPDDEELGKYDVGQRHQQSE